MRKSIAIVTTLISIIIAGCSKPLDLGNGYKFEHDGMHCLVLVDSQNIVKVDGHILEYAFDSSYIILSQRPWDSVCDISKMNYNRAINAFIKSDFSQYWIIIKNAKSKYTYNTETGRATYSNIYGPYTKECYLKMRDALGLPKILQLKDNRKLRKFAFLNEL
jgi:hypothetical protein